MIYFIFFILVFTFCSDNSVNPPDIPIIPIDIPSDEAPAWSPDGKFIAYWHFDPNDIDSSNKTGLYLIDTNSREQKLIINGHASNPDWKPDSDYLAFNYGRDIFQIDINSLELTAITQIGSVFFPNYSPNGNYIAFDQTTQSSNFRFDSLGIWIYSLHDRFRKHLGLGRDPDWNITGDEIVYVGPHGSTNTESQIWKVDTSGANKVQLTNNKYIQNRYPAWSPDGEKIAWSISSPEIYFSDIWIMNSDGSHQQRLIVGSYPCWSPDSRKLCFIAPLSDRSKCVLWIYHIHDLRNEQLTY